MARLRTPDPPAAEARPAWLHRFVPADWFDPTVPVDQAAEGFSAGGLDPVEVRWCRLAVAARHTWNAAREKWFWEHGDPEAHYRVRLTGETPHDIDGDEAHVG